MRSADRSHDVTSPHDCAGRQGAHAVQLSRLGAAVKEAMTALVPRSVAIPVTIAEVWCPQQAQWPPRISLVLSSRAGLQLHATRLSCCWPKIPIRTVKLTRLNQTVTLP